MCLCPQAQAPAASSSIKPLVQKRTGETPFRNLAGHRSLRLTVSRILSPAQRQTFKPVRPFLCGVCRHTPQAFPIHANRNCFATYPRIVPLKLPCAGVAPRAEAVRIFGLAAGGVCHAGDVTIAAVRSYRTISPLRRLRLERRGGKIERASLLHSLLSLHSSSGAASAVSFCCTFRRLAPPWRYQAPCPAQFGLSSPGGVTRPARPLHLPQYC